VLKDAVRVRPDLVDVASVELYVVNSSIVVQAVQRYVSHNLPRGGTASELISTISDRCLRLASVPPPLNFPCCFYYFADVQEGMKLYAKFHSNNSLELESA